MAAIRKLIESCNLSDCVFCVAAGALGYGLWLIHPAMAFIVMGSLFLILTVYGRFK